MWAILHDQCAVVELLLQLGAQVNHRAWHGVAALHVAAFTGSEEIFDLLIAQGASTEIEACLNASEKRTAPLDSQLDEVSRELIGLVRDWKQGKDACDGGTGGSQEKLTPLLLRQQRTSGKRVS